MCVHPVPILAGALGDVEGEVAVGIRLEPRGRRFKVPIHEFYRCLFRVARLNNSSSAGRYNPLRVCACMCFVLFLFYVFSKFTDDGLSFRGCGCTRAYFFCGRK